MLSFVPSGGGGWGSVRAMCIFSTIQAASSTRKIAIMILMKGECCLGALTLIVPQMAVECRLRDTEYLRGFRLVTGLFDHLLYERPFHPRQYGIAARELDRVEQVLYHFLERAQRLRLDALPVLDDIRRQVLGKDRVLLGDDHQPVYRVLQFPDVAGPVVVGQVDHRLGRNALGGNIVQPAVHRQEMVAEKLDVLPSLDQRRYPYREDVYPVVEVLAELSLLDELQEVLVSGANDPGVRPYLARSAHPEELVVL